MYKDPTRDQMRENVQALVDTHKDELEDMDCVAIGICSMIDLISYFSYKGVYSDQINRNI